MKLETYLDNKSLDLNTPALQDLIAEISESSGVQVTSSEFLN